MIFSLLLYYIITSYDKQIIRNYLGPIHYDKKTPIMISKDTLSLTGEKYLSILSMLVPNECISNVWSCDM